MARYFHDTIELCSAFMISTPPYYDQIMNFSFF